MSTTAHHLDGSLSWGTGAWAPIRHRSEEWPAHTLLQLRLPKSSPFPCRFKWRRFKGVGVRTATRHTYTTLHCGNGHLPSPTSALAIRVMFRAVSFARERDTLRNSTGWLALTLASWVHLLARINSLPGSSHLCSYINPLRY